MNSNHIKLSILLFSVISILTSCLTLETATDNITVKRKAIPPDFGKGESILICVLSGKNSFDKYMKKHVQNHYKGNYEFVLKEDLELVKYKDSTAYRYIFNRKLNKRKSSSYNSKSNRHETNYTYTSSFFIVDKKENITYKCPIRAASFSKIIEAYMINLEKVRIQNKS